MAKRKAGQQQIRTIQQSIYAIQRALWRLGPLLWLSDNGSVPKRRLKLSPKRRAALKVHGSYLGHIRGLKPAQKAKVKALKAKKGYPAAIRLAKQLAAR